MLVQQLGGGASPTNTQLKPPNNATPSPSPTTQEATSIAGLLGGDLTNAVQGQQQQALSLQNELALGPQALSFAQQQQGQQYGYQQQQFGVQQGGLGISGTELQQEQQHLGQQYGFQQRQDVLSGQGIQAALANLTKQYGYQLQDIGQGGAASGTLTTNSNTQARERAAEQFGYQKWQLGQQQQELKLSEAQQKEQFGYSQQQLENGKRKLALQQQSLGISEAQANTQYQNALQQLGLNNIMSVDQLKEQLGAVIGGGWSPITSFLGQLSQLLPGALQGLAAPQQSTASGSPTPATRISG